MFSKRLKNATKEDKESVKEEKDATSGPSTSKFNGNDTKEPEASSTTRKPSHENIPSTGRRRSRGLEILGIGEPSTRSKSPRRRSPNSTTSRNRSPAPGTRNYKYWMMVDWTPEVIDCFKFIEKVSFNASIKYIVTIKKYKDTI